MKQFRYILRLTLAFLLRFKGIIVLGIILGVFISIFLGLLFSSFYRSTQKVGIVGRFQTDTLPEYVLNLISDGLTTINENGEPTPSLAESWEVQDNGKTWVFKLKDATWQDGEKLTSSNLVYEFSDVTIERPDEKTIVFKLQNPFSPFPSVVSRPTFRTGLLGTGEWKVKNIIATGSYVSEINLRDKDKNRLKINFYPSTDQMKTAYKLGEIDSMIDLVEPQPFDKWNNSIVEKSLDYQKVVTLFFNTEDKLLGDKTVRQALSYAINKDNFAGERAISPISPKSWSFNPQVKQYAYDSVKAKDLLSDTSQELLNEPIKIVTSPELLTTAEKIRDDWKEIEVESIVQVSSIIPKEFQVYLTIFDLPDDPDQYAFWHSTQTESNISNYKSPRIDKILEDGRIEINPTERKKLYIDFQRFLAEDSPATFLYYPSIYTVKRK